MNTKKWMKDIDGKRNLFSLNLPATHNSAARYVKLSLFSKCQDRDIYTQLCNGIRVLDLRVKSKNERLYLVHGRADIFCDKQKKNAMDLQYVVDACKKFLAENKSETVVFQFKNDDEKEQSRCFELLREKYLDSDGWYLENRVPSLDEARGKIVLLRRCITSENDGIDVSLWIDQGEKEAKALVLKSQSGEFVIQDRYSFSPQKKWNLCAKPLLENAFRFDNRYILNYLSTAGGLKIPKLNAIKLNELFSDFVLDNNKYYGTIYLDFPSETLIKKIIKSNSFLEQL